MTGKPNRGRLIAVDGTRGPRVVSAAKGLLRRLRIGSRAGGGISRWDASGIFYEISCGEQNEGGASPRILMLLFASDLLFRLRWQILPALEEGRLVIAAPYVETAIAVGRAAGLPRRWLVELFRFAPPPDESFRIKEGSGRSAGEGSGADGFVEFCVAQFRMNRRRASAKGLRKRAVACLDSLERRGKSSRLWRG